jgi:hypothetical protein
LEHLVQAPDQVMSDELSYVSVSSRAGDRPHRHRCVCRGSRCGDVDVACGEEYNVLLRGAPGASPSRRPRSTIRARFADGQPEFRQADCGARFRRSFVVSFETIEHVAAQEASSTKAPRAAAGGLVVFPANKVSTDKRDVTNEFHVHELATNWPALCAFRPPHGTGGRRLLIVWLSRANARRNLRSRKAPPAPTPEARPLLHRRRSAAKEAVAGITPLLSVLADRDEWIYRDYVRVTRGLVAALRDRGVQEAELAALHARHAEALRERDALRAAFDTQAAVEAERVRLAALVVSQQNEVSRRASFRWWLALPFRRFWRALNGLPPGGYRLPG